MQDDKLMHIGFRCRKSDLKRIDKLAQANGNPRAIIMRSFFPPNQNWIDILLNHSQLSFLKDDPDVKNSGNFIYQLAAYGLRCLMEAEGVDPYVFDGSTPVDIVTKYLHYQQAVLNTNGKLLESGTLPCYHFEIPPSGGTWEKRGIKGKIILHNKMRLTQDGFEHLIDEDMSVKV